MCASFIEAHTPIKRSNFMIHSLIIAAATPKDPISDLLAILLVGGGGGLFLIVKGKTEENPREFQEGLLSLVGGGALIAATFAVQAIFK